MSGWQNKPFKIDVEKDQKLAFCMCGKSKNGPFCDGSHKGSGISPEVIKFEEHKTIYACGCTQSNKRPFCDGTHNKL